MPMFLFYTTVINQMLSVYEGERQSLYMNSANIIASYVTSRDQLNDPNEKAKLDIQMKDKSREGNYRVLLLNEDAYVISDTNNSANGKIYIMPETMSALGGTDLVTTHEDEESIYAAASITSAESGNDVLGVILVVGDVSDIYTLIDEMERVILMYTAIFSVLILMLVYLFSKFLLAPFSTILNSMGKMTDGHLDERISITRNDEFGEIANSFNNMAIKLQHADENRDEFVSNVSHELKTPLSSMKVLSESILLMDDVPKEVYLEFLQDINSEIDRMTHIVNDLLQLVKLDQKNLALNITKVNLHELVASIVKRLKALADKKGLELELIIEREATIDADETKITLAISNLIENGIKYTEKGFVKVTVASDNQNAFVIVEDTGSGIPEEEQDKIFTRFYRVDKMRDRETGGTGLGLSITHSTVLLHNGSIRVKSTEDVGSVFTVRFPKVVKYEEKN